MNNKILSNSGLAILGGAFMVMSSSSLAGIANTRHNLGSNGTAVAGQNRTSSTAEICVFCHTPHGASTAAVVPLWNKSMPETSTFTTYDDLGTTSLDAATAQVGSVSIACLSCHDGSQAMDTVINAPGSGLGSGTIGVVGNWTGNNQTDGQLNGNTVALLGTDLRNDHPVSIQYAGGGISNNTHTVTNNVSNAPASTTYGDPDFVVPKGILLNSGNPVWWVETGGNSTRSKTDIQLYTRNTASTADVGSGFADVDGLQPFVECASCHDPHTESVDTFLRISNDDSAVCLACHIK